MRQKKREKLIFFPPHPFPLQKRENHPKTKNKKKKNKNNQKEKNKQWENRTKEFWQMNERMVVNEWERKRVREATRRGSVFFAGYPSCTVETHPRAMENRWTRIQLVWARHRPLQSLWRAMASIPRYQPLQEGLVALGARKNGVTYAPSWRYIPPYARSRGTPAIARIWTVTSLNCTSLSPPHSAATRLHTGLHAGLYTIRHVYTHTHTRSLSSYMVHKSVSHVRRYEATSFNGHCVAGMDYVGLNRGLEKE